MLLNLNHPYHNLERSNIHVNNDCHSIPIDILDDLSSRFIINLPQHERENIIRAMFQIEQAHWFYKDFLCVQRPGLQKLQLRPFARIMFNHVPFLRTFLKDFDSCIDKWKAYKSNVPTYGAILLDDKWENVLMVQGFCSHSSWGFPKGKVNAEEDPILCAVREVKEETGFDCSQLIKANDFIELKIRDTCVRLYIVPGVKRSEKFVAQTRGEIKDIKWFPLNKLPTHKSEKDLNANAFFMAIPFIKHLKRWIYEQKKLNSFHSNSKRHRYRENSRSTSESDNNGYQTNGGSESPPLNHTKNHHDRKQRKFHGNSETGVAIPVTKFWAKSWENFNIDWDNIWDQILRTDKLT